MKILVLTRYAIKGASSRMRFYQYVPMLREAGFECEVYPLLDDATLSGRYRYGGYGIFSLLTAYAKRMMILFNRHDFDLIWVEKEALPWMPAWLELRLLRGVPYALDYDDAIFHNYDLHHSNWVKCFFGKRIDKLMASASLIVAGNHYLAQRALAAGAQRVELLPTVVDLDRYITKTYVGLDEQVSVPRLVWIGSPSTLKYLELIAKPLAMLAKLTPFSLRIIGGGYLSIPGVDVETLAWSEQLEAELIEECEVGIMPLLNTPWEHGKCAYKLIQYMACGLPTVASPVGANCEVIIDEVTGFFANSDEAWVEKLERLLRDATLRKQLGDAGRERVAAHYCLQKATPQLVDMLKNLGKI